MVDSTRTAFPTGSVMLIWRGSVSASCVSGTTTCLRIAGGVFEMICRALHTPHPPTAARGSLPLPEGRGASGVSDGLTPTTSSSSARGPAAMSPRSGRRSWVSRPRSSSASCSAASASTGAAFRPRRCCARPKCCTNEACRRLWPQQREAVVRPRQGGRAQPRGGEAAQPGRHAPDEEEQDRGGDGRGQAHRRRTSSASPARTARRPTFPPSTSSSPPARGRATCRSPRPTASASGPTATP